MDIIVDPKKAKMGCVITLQPCVLISFYVIYNAGLGQLVLYKKYKFKLHNYYINKINKCFHL